MNHSREVLNYLANRISSNRPMVDVLTTIVKLEAENANEPIIKKRIYEDSQYSPKVVDNAVSFLEGGLLLDHTAYGTKHEYFLTPNGQEVVKSIYKGGQMK